MEYNFDTIVFKIHRNRSAHYPAILKLYRETSAYKKSFNFIEKKYNTEIYGKSHIGYLAFDASNIASYYGVFPIKMTCNGIDYLAAQSGDTLTHPNYQKKGLFTYLAKETYKLAMAEHIDFVFGFPNQNSLPGFQKKLEWVFNYKMLEIVIPVNTLPIGEVFSKLSTLNKIYLSYTRLILEKHKVEASEIDLEGFNTQFECLRVKKDIDFFNYKKYSDAILINKDNFLIFLKVETHLIIGDVAYFDKERFPAFLNAIKQLAKTLLVFKIKFYLSANHWLFGYLKEQFTPIENNAIGFCFFNETKTLSIENALFSAADFDTF